MKEWNSGFEKTLSKRRNISAIVSSRKIQMGGWWLGAVQRSSLLMIIAFAAKKGGRGAEKGHFF